MASIRKRGSSYEITVSNGYDSSGKKITETETWKPEPGMSQKAIDKALNEFVVDFERDVKSGKNIKGARMTLYELSKLYLEDMKPPTLARTTYKDYKDRLDNRIIPAMGHIKIGNLRNNDVKNYKKMLKAEYRNPKTKKPLSDSSIKKDCVIISAMLSYAVSEGLLDMNMLIYAGKVTGRKEAKKETLPKYFTMEQLIRLIDALERPIEIVHKEHKTTVRGKQYGVKEYVQTFQVPNKWKLYFYIALFAGDRRGENVSLTWNDLNMETCEINIDKSTDYVDGTMGLKDTKTHNIRENTLPPYVIEIAKSWKAEQIQQCFRKGETWLGYKGSDYDKNFIFTQANGSQMHICSPYTTFKRIIRIYNQYAVENEKDKIPDNIPPHGLRHSAAAILISNNMDVRTVAVVLGHSNPSTTLNIYSYFFKGKGKEAAQIMENSLLPTKTVVGK